MIHPLNDRKLAEKENSDYPKRKLINQLTWQLDQERFQGFSYRNYIAQHGLKSPGTHYYLAALTNYPYDFLKVTSFETFNICVKFTCNFDNLYELQLCKRHCFCLCENSGWKRISCFDYTLILASPCCQSCRAIILKFINKTIC